MRGGGVMPIYWSQHRGTWTALDPKQPMLFGQVYPTTTQPPFHWAVSTDERRTASGDSDSVEQAKEAVEAVFRTRAKASVRHAP